MHIIIRIQLRKIKAYYLIILLENILHAFLFNLIVISD